MKPPLVIRGQWGLGDNIFARPIIKAAVEKYTVWLETPWPELFEDLPIFFLRAERQLRTQMRNVCSQPAERWSKPPGMSKGVKLFYGHVELRSGSIINALERQIASVDVRLVDPIWDLPDLGPSPFTADRPIAIIRPVTVRKEWRNEARNPRPEYVIKVARDLMLTHHVVLVGDLRQGHEWLIGDLPPHHTAFLAGELSVRPLLALAREADLIVGGVGWIVPASIALHRKAFIILGGHGGHNAPSVITDRRMDLSLLDFATPKGLCPCTKMSHRCNKMIPDLMEQWNRFRFRQNLPIAA